MVFLSEEQIKKSILPEAVVKKIMKEYVTHPVADLLRTRVTFFPNLIPHDQYLIYIGIHDGNNMYAPYRWSTKENEDINYSMRMEELVLTNKLIDNMIKAGVKPDDLQTSHYSIHEAIGRLDDTYRHCNRTALIFIVYAHMEMFLQRFRQRLRWIDGGGGESDEGSGGEEEGREESDGESD